MAGPGDILITIGAKTAEAVGELGHLNTALDKTASTGDKMKSGLQKAALPAAAALTAVTAAAISAGKAAMEDAALYEHFSTALKNTTSATDAQISAVEDYIGKTEQATGVADDQLVPAFEALARATGDTTEAQTLMNQVLDISAATGKDVETVANAVAKAHEGQTAQLAKLAPGLSEAARKSKDFDVIMGELADTTGGAMASAANTAQGQMARLKIATGNLNEQLGYILLPILEKLLPMLTQMAIFAQQNSKLIAALAAVVAVLSAGILAANVAIKAYEALQIAVKVATAAWTAAQWLLNAALSANPIGLVVAAIAALAAGLVIAYKKSETFRDIVQGALHAVEAAGRALEQAFKALWDMAKQAFDWIVAHWQVAAFAFGPLGVAIALIAENWDKVAAAARAAGDIMSSVLDAVSSAIHSVIGAVESLISALGRIHVPDIHLPHIPGVNLAYAGAPAVAGYSTGPAPRGAVATGPTFNIYGAVDPEGTARAVRRVLMQSDRRMGRSS